MDPDSLRKYVSAAFLRENDQINQDNIYQPLEGDIIIVGTPKSGTTWMQQIVHQIRTKGDETFDDIYKVTRFIPNPKVSFSFNVNVDQPAKPRVFKHHESYGVIKSTDKQKHIVIIRNPYDGIYSWSKFVNGYYGGQKEISDEDLAESLVKLHHANIMGFFNVILTWWPHRNDRNVLFLFYEDLQTDLKRAIKLVSEFIAIPLTDVELDRIATFCSFDYMVKQKDKFQAHSMVEVLANGLGLEKWTPIIGMVRPEGGKIGEGKHLGPKLKETIDKLWKATATDQLGFLTYDDLRSCHSKFMTK